jgi:glycosyltransferase involved in cell wall biosynthesis
MTTRKGSSNSGHDRSPRVGCKTGRVLFISWALNCSRSDSIAQRLGGTSYMVYSPIWGSRYLTAPFKYACQSFSTLRLLFRERPTCVIVMTPPLIACLVVWVYARLMKAEYIIDAHTAAFVESPWDRILFLHGFFSRRALTTIVTNEHLKGIVESWRANATIVTDVPLCFAPPKPMSFNGKCTMTFVSSFTKDEPLAVFLEAARQLPDIQFLITGNVKDADAKIMAQKPANVDFTGYLPDSEYVGVLLASDAIISLTTEEHTMQRGAYEAVYLGKPVITSNTHVLRHAFDKGTVHVEPTVEGIRQGVRNMQQNRARYASEVGRLRAEKLERWNTTEEKLRAFTSLSQTVHRA